MSFEESFAPARRLSQLSKKSPACAATATIVPIARIWPASRHSKNSVVSPEVACATTYIQPPIQSVAPTIPPSSPAQVFEGLIDAAIFGPPSVRPNA